MRSRPSLMFQAKDGGREFDSKLIETDVGLDRFREERTSRGQNAAKPISHQHHYFGASHQGKTLAFPCFATPKSRV